MFKAKQSIFVQTFTNVDTLKMLINVHLHDGLSCY